MNQITAAQFRAAVELDPAWSSKLTEPVEITDYCDMEETKITHLSHLLHFTGKNEVGSSASFWGCTSLKIAEGNFSGFVCFNNTDIQKIGDLTCGKNNDGNSANFWECKFLKVAEGNFAGWVGFCYASIERIGDLTCGENKRGSRLNVENCLNLKSIPISFAPGEVKASPKLIEKLEVDRFIRKKREEIVEIWI